MSYWTFDGKVALEGVEGVVVSLDDCFGRSVTQPDEDEPAVLSAVEILNALQTSRAARADFRRLFPTLSAGAQARLTTLLEENPRVSALITSDQHWADAEQLSAIRRIPVRTVGRRGGKGYAGGS